MTIIAYSPGLLVADSRAVLRPDELGENSILASQVRRKLRVLAGNRFAVANSGPICTPGDWQELERILLHYLMILEEFEPERTKIEFEEDHGKAAAFYDRNLLVMSRQHLYVVARQESDRTTSPVKSLVRMDPDECFAYGSGLHIAHVAFAAGFNAQQAAEFIIEQDVLTGPPIVAVQQKQLRPLIAVHRVARKTNKEPA